MRKLFSLVLAVLCYVWVQHADVAYAESTSTELQIGQEISSNITNDVGSEYYKVTLKQPGLLSIKVTSYMNFLNVNVYDENNDEVMSKWNFTGANSVNPIPWMGSEYLEAGTYTIKIAQNSDLTGKYKLTTSFTAANNNESESNNGADLAQTLATNSKQITGLISWNDSEDYYKVKLTKPGLLTLNISSYMNYLNVEMYDEEGDEVMSKWNFSGAKIDNAIPFTGSEYLEAGTYFIKVSRNSDLTGKYKIKTSFTATLNNEKESNNGGDLAQNLTPNTQKITGLISWNDDVDYYKVIIKKTGFVSFKVSSYLDILNVYVYDNNNNEVMSKWNFSGANSKNPIPWTGTANLSKGTYLIKVSKASDLTGKYTLSVSVPNAPPKSPTVNSVKKGATIVTGKTYSKSAVTVKIGKKKYTAKSNSKGSFTIKVPTLKSKTTLYVSVKTSAGTSLAKKVIVK